MNTLQPRRKIFAALIITLSLALQSCAFLAASYKPEPMVLELADSLVQEERLEQSRKLYTILPPENQAPGQTTGQAPKQALSPSGKREAIIFYPGGKVRPLAYLPLWEGVAKAGYTVFVPTMPLNLAVFGVGAAEKVRKEHPEYEVWHLAGHSLGGAMAAEHLKKNSRGFRSLILLGSYPASDLSGIDLAALSIKEELGLEGGLQKAEESRNLLPAGAIYKMMPGANHAQFGRYGIQKGDGTALLSPEAQTALTTLWVLEFLGRL
ncbi:MAG: alpha/beta hydrolase [Spirochaetia bacterium]|jgi:pimeloyl-ACP methyl ester carboxylesterase|nr:alpha/beta hydrolase [Spirochaetia bacterium]